MFSIGEVLVVQTFVSNGYVMLVTEACPEVVHAVIVFFKSGIAFITEPVGLPPLPLLGCHVYVQLGDLGLLCPGSGRP